MFAFWSVVNAVATFVMAFSAAYFFLAFGLGMRQVRRDKTSMGFQSYIPFGDPHTPLVASIPDARIVYFLIACLNEGAVIASTVAALRTTNTSIRLIVIDDGSDDDTAQQARDAGGAQVRIVQRTQPMARLGKGAALNAGFELIRTDVSQQGLDTNQVVVCVMDADGKLSNGAMAEVLPLFDDPLIGGVQLAVRIRNRTKNFILQFQDHQFWTQSAVTQFGRVSTSSVSLGGNGQFVRLSALLEVGDQPWSNSLTEDLDLTVSIAVRGWRTTTTPRAAVDQQGVDRFAALIRQRTRWYQGHMMTLKRLPEIFRSEKMSGASSLEMTLYILSPWIFDLPWSILFHLILIELIPAVIALNPLHSGIAGFVLYFVVWYLLGFWPAIFTTVIARRRDPSASWGHSLKMGHAFVVTNYLSYICVWRALYRIVRRQNGWAKTIRLAEPNTPTPEHAGLGSHS